MRISYADGLCLTLVLSKSKLQGTVIDPMMVLLGLEQQWGSSQI